MFIAENCAMLGQEHQRAILRRVLRVSPSAASASGRTGVDVNLDSLDPDTLAFVYNIVKARRDFLCKPAS